jgi:hypothetical protein
MAESAQKKWGPASLPAPTAPSEGYAGVRSTWSRPVNGSAPRFSILAHQLRRRIPSNSSLQGRSPIVLLDCAARRFAGLSTVPACPRGRQFRGTGTLRSKPSDVPRPFLGRPLSRPALSSAPKCFEPRRARGRSTLPAPLPGWPRQKPEGPHHCLPAEIGPLVPAAPSCRCRPSGEAGTAVPITQ